jgi:hypothetical protein
MQSYLRITREPDCCKGKPMRSPVKTRRNEALTALAARADRDFSGVAGYSGLTAFRKLRLFADLLEAKRHFEFRSGARETPKDSAAAALLDNVRQSISKVAEFGETALGLPETKGSNGAKAKPATPQGAKALRMLEAGGERWARQQIKAGGKLPATFQSPWQAAGVTHYGADIFIAEFLRAARIMEAIVAAAGKPVAKTGIEGLPVIFENSPMEWIVGKALPAIYSRTFRQPFTATVKTDAAKTSNGIKFVRASCLALELPGPKGGPTDNTIRTHWRSASNRNG